MSAHRLNNLDSLRLAGALSVIVGHSYYLLGMSQALPDVLGYPIQTLGVVIFFSISGYLITASWNRTRDPVAYFAARFLRIFPALIVVALVTVLVIGPLVTTLPLDEYFRDPRTWSYLDNIRMLPQFILPGVFVDAPYANVVNGSLWTLAVEFFCYLVVPVLLAAPKLFRAPLLAAAMAVSLWLFTTPAVDSPVVYGTRLCDAAEMWLFFVAGALLRLAHERWRGIFRTDVAVALMAGYLCFTSLWEARFDQVAWIALPYVLLTIGLASTPYVRRAARYGDLSYGLYVWAFPVQQLVVQAMGVRALAINLSVVVVVTGALAWLSWHLVEGPSLKLKSRTVRWVKAGRHAGPQPATAEAA